MAEQTQTTVSEVIVKCLHYSLNEYIKRTPNHWLGDAPEYFCTVNIFYALAKKFMPNPTLEDGSDGLYLELSVKEICNNIGLRNVNGLLAEMLRKRGKVDVALYHKCGIFPIEVKKMYTKWEMIDRDVKRCIAWLKGKPQDNTEFSISAAYLAFYSDVDGDNPNKKILEKRVARLEERINKMIGKAPIVAEMSKPYPEPKEPRIQKNKKENPDHYIAGCIMFRRK